MRTGLFFTLLVALNSGQGQTTQEAFKALHEINSLGEYETFRANYAGWEINLKIIHPSNGFYSMDQAAQLMYNGKVGDTLYYSLCPECSKNAWKLIDISPRILYKTDFIYLKNTDYPGNQLDSLTSVIMNKYKSGVAFSELISTYNNKGAKYVNQPWHCEGSYVKEFEDAVKVHQPKEIFYVDSPTFASRFIVVKTAPDSSALAPTIIEIKLKATF